MHRGLAWENVEGQVTVISVLKNWDWLRHQPKSFLI